MYTYWAQVWDLEQARSAWSTGQSFVIAGESRPGAANLISPQGAITESDPTFVWNAVSDSSWYHLWVNDSSGQIFSQWCRAENVYDQDSETCFVTPGLSLSTDDYTWWIRT
jgi:hypothetical protein